MDLGQSAAQLARPSEPEWIGRPPHEERQTKAHPLLPTDDPFYQPPPGFEHALPGTVLRTRDVDVAFLGLIPVRASATQLLFRTMDMNGEPEAAGVDHCFGVVRLHRVEATVRPENVASRSVLDRVGFREEGLLRRYLDVDGGWRDHLLVAITAEEVSGSLAASLVREGRAHWA